MKLPIIGQAYEHPSQDVNYQRCINMFLTSAGPEGRGEQNLLPTPGLKQLVDLSGSEVRGLIQFTDGDIFYAVVDEIFYEITINRDAQTATSTNRGTLNTTNGLVSMAINPTQVMIVDGSTDGYIYTVSTTTLTTIADVDFTGGTQVRFFDSYFFYNTPDAATVFNTAINDGSTISALDVFTAEGSPDDTVGIFVDKRELWVFGEKSIEVWFDAANSSGTPLTRRDGAFIDQGCAAAFSIVRFDNTLIWLDDRGYIVKADGYSPVIISTEAINKEISSYEIISDAVAFTYNDRGHLFYQITFPTAQKTWVFDALTRAWHERAYFNQEGEFEQHLGHVHLKTGQLDIVGAHNSGKLYIMSHDSRDDAGDPIHRLRTTQFQQFEFDLIGVDNLEIHLEAGKGLSTGVGSDPQMMMRYSHDGGYTWSNEIVRSSGKIGEYNKRIRWNRLGVGREWIFEFRFTDPIDFAIIDAAVQVDGGGDA